ncbi:hypothetical protein KCP69_25960 [Salmonella enterica subsp. enterica]|nr:hypothetical protein KCP69_25960 [Salmonella enterica subsp. enterica]
MFQRRRYPLRLGYVFAVLAFLPDLCLKAPEKFAEISKSGIIRCNTAGFNAGSLTGIASLASDGSVMCLR